MSEVSGYNGYFRNAVIVIPVTTQNYQYVDATFRSILDTIRYGHDICLVSYSIGSACIELLQKRVRSGSVSAKVFDTGSTNGDPLLFAAGILVDKYADCDFIITHPGVMLPGDWDKKLATVAYSDAHIGAVSPMCGNSRLFGMQLSGGSDSDSFYFINSCLQHVIIQTPYNKVDIESKKSL